MYRGTTAKGPKYEGGGIRGKRNNPNFIQKENEGEGREKADQNPVLHYERGLGEDTQRNQKESLRS